MADRLLESYLWLPSFG